MASPNSSWTDVLTTTLYSRTKSLADNVSDNSALLFKMKKNGRIKTVSGGASIIQELEYAESSNFSWYSGYEPLNLAAQELFSAAQFEWKQAACPVVISGLEMLQNSGKERMISLIASRVGNAEKTMANNISAGLYAAGTGNGGKEIGGLQHIVADTNTNTVGGISGSTYSWWKNVVYDLSSVGSTASATNIQTHMNNVWVQLVRNNDAPDLIVMDNVYYTKFLGSLQTIQRIVSDDMAKAGFTSLRYINADVVLDGGAGGNCPASHAYFLNTDYLFYRPHADRNMEVLGEDRFSTNQDALVRIIGWAGNMTCSNRFLQGNMKA